MRRKRPDAISDYYRHGCLLRVECGTCARAVLIGRFIRDERHVLAT
jgi:hypothetical protein